MKLTERELWLMRQAFNDGVCDENFDAWLNDGAADGVTVADVLAWNAPPETVVEEFLRRTGRYVTNDASRDAAIAAAVAAEREACAAEIERLREMLTDDHENLWEECIVLRKYVGNNMLMSDFRNVDEMRAEIERLTSINAALTAKSNVLTHHLTQVIGDHNAPSDCYSSGPLHGDARDVVCPACDALRLLSNLRARSAK